MNTDKIYWIIAVKWEGTDPWTMEFGDWDKNVVRQEARDSYDSDVCYRRRILGTTGKQSDIDATMLDLNER